VQNAEDLARDRQLAARRFFASLDHPTLGPVLADRSPLWPWHEKTLGWKSAPLLGEDNRYVFVKLLKHSEAEFRSLVKRGVLY
jgi:crotonobetainyl-CoA:carnitine CoA-transferase CaiB-like acyl-CoA transferase